MGGEDRVYYPDDQENLLSIPAKYTHVDGGDPFVLLAAGRSLFRTEDSLDLIRLIQAWKEREEEA